MRLALDVIGVDNSGDEVFWAVFDRVFWYTPEASARLAQVVADDGPSHREKQEARGIARARRHVVEQPRKRLDAIRVRLDGLDRI